MTTFWVIFVFFWVVLVDGVCPSLSPSVSLGVTMHKLPLFILSKGEGLSCCSLNS